MSIEVSDRYQGVYPDPSTVCKGECEGLGMYPVWRGSVDEQGRMEIDGKDHWEFVVCLDCHGSGKSAEPPSQIDLLAAYILKNFPGEILPDEGAGDVAIRLLERYRSTLND